MTSSEIIKALRDLADSMEKHNPDHELRDRLIPALIQWSIPNHHGAEDVVQKIGKLLSNVY